MTITDNNGETSPWLLLVFTLPASKASERVGIWRKLQKVGSIQLRNAGYLLPNNPVNQERFEWLATAIRGFKGEASILQVQAIDDLSPRALQEQFRQVRTTDYETLIAEAKKLKPVATGPSAQLLRLRRRYEEIVDIDFFESPLRRKADEVLKQVGQPRAKVEKGRLEMVSKADYQNRMWMTRPRPGIDRVSSAWLIARFIDPKARFIFANDPKTHADAVPFDMFQAGGFGHEEDHCTFETICRRFGIKDKAARVIGEAIHDADLEDGRFGRGEGIAINSILRGWDRQGLTDNELLKRGMELIEGLYQSLSGNKR
jgi:hypothetical protein